MSRLALYFLGTPRLERDGSQIEVDTRKATALMAYLAVTRREHSRESLAAFLWPEYDQQHARGALRRTLSVLRSRLGSEWLTVSQETLGINWQAGPWVDVEQFGRAVASYRTPTVRTGELEEAPQDGQTEHLAAAVELYRGDFMAGFTLRDSPEFDDWQFMQSESLRRDLAGLLERLVRAYGRRGEWEQALAYARRWLALDPLHEPVHRELMRLYVAAGQRSAALRQYQECVRVLQQELGVAPLDETTQLYERIKERRAPATPGNTAGVTVPGTLGGGYPATEAPAPWGSEGSSALESRRRAASAGGPLQVPFVGRKDEWEQLLGAYGRASAGGQLVVVEGEAGIGKTRLAEEFISHVSASGSVTIAARCYQGEAGLAYAPFIEALRAVAGISPAGASAPQLPARLAGLPAEWMAEASRLLPALPLRAAGELLLPPLDGPGAQARFFEGVSQVLAAGCMPVGSQDLPGVLFFDDAQWMDAASLGLLTYLARRLSTQPLCLLVTYRGDEVDRTHPLRRLLADAHRAGRATHIVLQRLTSGAVAQLLEDADPASTRALSHRLYRETEGLPFFVVEYLAALATGTLQGSESGDWITPGGVRDLIHARLAGLTEAGRQLVGTAAVVGRSFDFDILKDVSGRTDDEAVAGLEELLAQALVREVPGGKGIPAYDFVHEKLCAIVYEETSLARRRLLHRRVAECLVARAHGRDATGSASLIAGHYRLAGQDMLAAEYYVRAGKHARSLYANVEALGHFQAALALDYPDAAGLYEAIGDLQTLLGDYAAGLSSYHTALALAGQPAGSNGGPAGDEARPEQSVARRQARDAEIEHKLGMLHLRRGEWELAAGHLQDALLALDQAATKNEPAEGMALRSHLLADWSLAMHRLGRNADAEQLARHSYDLAGQAGDDRALAQAENILGMLARARGELSAACRHLEASAGMAEALGDPALHAAALNNLALTAAAAGEYDRAEQLTKDALELVHKLGDRHREAALHNNLADLLHRRGDRDGAMSHLKQAVTIFADIRTETDGMQPEIWKLSEW